MRKSIIVLLLLLLVGCGERELINGIDSKQSIEILVVLNRAGISADRAKQTKGRNESFLITVNNNDYTRAMEVLHEYGLPRRNQDELENITRSNGIVPESIGMATLRREIALSLQVEKLLLAFPGVVDARVIIRSEENSPNIFRNEMISPRATVVIRYITSGDKPEFSEEEVRRLVARSVSGLDENNVMVSFSKVLGITGRNVAVGSEKTVKLFPFRFRIVESDLTIAKRQLLGVLIILVLVGGGVGIFVNYLYKKVFPAKEAVPQALLDDNKLVIEPNPAKLTTRRPTLMFKQVGSKDNETS